MVDKDIKVGRKLVEGGIGKVRGQGEVRVRFSPIEIREGMVDREGGNGYLLKRLEAVKGYMGETIDRYFSDKTKNLLSQVTIEWSTKVRISYYGKCCYRNNTIVMCSQMRYAIEECLDSMIWHEICHLEEHNHGTRFKALESQFPSFYQVRSYFKRFCCYVRANAKDLDMKDRNVEVLEEL